jgi:hypothetical protein
MRKLQLMVDPLESHRHPSLELWTLGPAARWMSMSTTQGSCRSRHRSLGNRMHTCTRAHIHPPTRVLASSGDTLLQGRPTGRSLSSKYARAKKRAASNVASHCEPPLTLARACTGILRKHLASKPARNKPAETESRNSTRYSIFRAFDVL